MPEVYRRLDDDERKAWFAAEVDVGRLRLKKGTTAGQRRRLQLLVFDRLSYDDKLTYCDRPEQIDGPSSAGWEAVNAHLGTTAASLSELVRELGMRRFGRVPRVGDAFCGGGSVPFEAARIGCDAYGSDLNPVAALLTWGALHIVGGGKQTAAAVRRAQERAFGAVDRQITEWRIEHNDAGWRADAFLYCTETRCPECGWLVPLAPSWVIGEKTRTVAELEPQPAERRIAIRIRSGASPASMAAARRAGTARQSRLICPNPNCGASTPMAAIRGDQRGEGGRGYGLRRWESGDLHPRPDDVFQERLYCVRWRLPRLEELLWAEQRQDVQSARLPEWVPLEHAMGASSALLDPDSRQELAALRKRDWQAEEAALAAAQRDLQVARRKPVARDLERLRRRVDDLEAARKRRQVLVAALAKAVPRTLYRDVRDDDLSRETAALALLRDNLADWQQRGFLPSRTIAAGAKTNEPIRTRGWTHWHHLFTPRQLLTHGLLLKQLETTGTECERVAMLLGVARCADWNSRLSRWHPHGANEKSEQVFSNQALNTLDSYAGRSLGSLDTAWMIRFVSERVKSGCVQPVDARSLRSVADIWLTDPPYADAVNYHELSEFFLAWYEKALPQILPRWYSDSKRVLAIQSTGSDFRRSMVECYRNLTVDMPDNGFQVVMFTHQDASVWADLTLILWAAGLRVTAAWTIATETESALKEGNYVQGTVLMVLRKQTTEDTAFLDEVVPEVAAEVERQLESMRDLDDRNAPNFTDADYQLAAYAAALRVLTTFRAIEDVDVAYELSREHGRGEANPLAGIIEDAVRTASNFLVPAGLPPHVWRSLAPAEKFYLKGVEVESHGDFRAPG